MVEVDEDHLPIPESVIIAVHLPVKLVWFSELLQVIAKEYPDTKIDYSQTPWRIDVGPT